MTMNNKRRKEMLEMAKEAIVAGIDVIDYVTLKDDKRGEFFGRITEYLKDAMKAPNGLEGYISDVEIELAAEPDPDALVTSWLGITLPVGYKAVLEGETMWANDMIYVGEKWDTLTNHFGKKARAMIGIPYPVDKFILCRKDYSQKSTLDEVQPLAGYSRIGPEEIIRQTDYVLTTNGTWNAMTAASAETQVKIGMRFKNAGLHSVIRRDPIKPTPQVPMTESPLTGFRLLEEGECILATDMIFVPERKSWAAVNQAHVVEAFGNLVGIMYLAKFGMITRFREDSDKTVTQVPLLANPDIPLLM